MAGDCGSSCPVSGGFYYYDPNVGSNAFFLALFVILAAIVPYLGFRSWTPLFSAVLTTGLLAEALGFVGRLLLHAEGDNRTHYFLFLLGTVWGPTFMSMAIFIVLPHILGIYGHPISPVRPLVAGLAFWSLGVVVLVVELAGVVIAAYQSTYHHRNRGTRLVAAGLGIQAVTLLACSGLHFWFTLGLATRRGSLDVQHQAVYSSSAFKRLTLAMEASTLLLVVYSVYRAIAFASGLSSHVYQSEAGFMVLGGAVPLVVAVLLTTFHPGLIFGDAWGETTPRGLTRSSMPPPVLHPNGHPTHHRYDPNIRVQASPMSQRLLRGSLGPPASSPGLPATPKPVSKPASSEHPPRVMSMVTMKDIGHVERKSLPPRNLVDTEGLW